MKKRAYKFIATTFVLFIAGMSSLQAQSIYEQPKISSSMEGVR